MITKKIPMLILSLLFSVLLVLVSIFIPQKLDHQVETVQLRLGMPINFVFQEQYTGAIGLPEGPQFPYWLVFSSPWENPTKVLWLPFVIDTVLFFMAFSLTFLLGNRILQKLQRTDNLNKKNI